MKGWKARAVAIFLACMVCIAPASFALADDAETQELEAQLEDLQRQAEEQQARTEPGWVYTSRPSTLKQQQDILTLCMMQRTTAIRQMLFLQVLIFQLLRASMRST